MPYTTADAVPKYVPEQYRAQWMEVWNSVYEKTRDEEAAFKQANGVIKKRKEESYEAALNPPEEMPPQNSDVDALKIDPLTLCDGELMSDIFSKYPIIIHLSAVMPTVEWDGKATCAIPVCVAGGPWHRQGDSFSISDADLDSIVANFEKRKNSHIVIDYEHASEHPNAALGGPVPAAGWIHRLYKRGTQLWANVEWTPQAEGMIKTGEYRFFSPALDWGFEDKTKGGIQGATMTSGALTNHPFLEELPPIMLSEQGQELSSEARAELMSPQSVHVPSPAQIVTGETISVATEQPDAQPPSDEEVIRPAVVNSETKSTSTKVASESSDGCDGSVTGQAQEPSGKEAMAEGKTKRVDDVDLPASAFLIVGDSDKTDTWHLPVHFPSEEQTKSHIQNALSRFNQTQGATPAVAGKLARLAKSKGINVEEFKKHLLEAGAQLKEALAEIEALENPMAKSTIKKIEEGKHEGRFGRFGEKGELLNVMPAGLNEQAMAEYAAELDEGGWSHGDITGMGNPETPGQKKEAQVSPHGNMLTDAEGKDEEPDGDEIDKDEKKQRASETPEVKLTDAQLLGMILYPASHAKRGRINLSEASRLVTAGDVSSADILRLQAAQEVVTESISDEKFLPKQRLALMRQALTDLNGFREFAASQPKLMLRGPLGVSKGASDTGTRLSEGVQQLLSERQKLDKNYTYAEALREFTREHPDVWPNISDAQVVEY